MTQIEAAQINNSRVLVTGATSGIGLTIAEELHLLGASVGIGTRSRDNFDKVARTLGNVRVHPFIADFRDSDGVSEATKQFVEESFVPTAVVHCAAGGMESFLPDIVRGIRPILKMRQTDRFKAVRQLDALQADITTWVAASAEDSRAVNFIGPKAFVEKIGAHLSPGAKFIFISSLMSSAYGVERVEIPSFYQEIARWKNEFEKFLDQQTLLMTGRGIYPAIVSGHLVADTLVGRSVERFFFPFISEEQRPPLETLPRMADMAAEVTRVLTSDPATWARVPYRSYVIGPGPEKIVHHLPLDLQLLHFRISP